MQWIITYLSIIIYDGNTTPMYKESLYMACDKRLKYITYNKRCTAGTSVGERLTTAFTECSPGLMRWGSLISISISVFCVLPFFMNFHISLLCLAFRKQVKRIQFSRSDDQCYRYWYHLKTLIKKSRFTVTWIYFCIFILQLRGDHGLGGRGVCRQVAVLLAHCCSTSQKYGQLRQSMHYASIPIEKLH